MLFAESKKSKSGEIKNEFLHTEPLEKLQEICFQQLLIVQLKHPRNYQIHVMRAVIRGQGILQFLPMSVHLCPGCLIPNVPLLLLLLNHSTNHIKHSS